MRTMVDLAQLIVASWVIASANDSLMMPTSDGAIDRALKAAADDPAFPSWAREMLHFVNSRFGLQCVESEALLQAAGKAKLTSDPNPTYTRTEVTATPRVARFLLARLGVSVDEARQIGLALKRPGSPGTDSMVAAAM
jgi:predicted lipoprotein